MGKSKKHKVLVQNIDESPYEGLMSSMRHARNRLLFFILFSTYSLLSILGTTDKMLFMESPVKMPLLNIELPLLAFYTVMPLFLLVLHLNLLYTFRSYRDFLITSKTHYPKAILNLPIGIYEGALLKQDSFHNSVRFVMNLLLYVFPVLVLTSFWLRFADYQSLALSLWHFISILLCMFLGFYFRGIIYLKSKRKLIYVSSLGLLNLFFFSIISSYLFLVIYPITKNDVSLAELEKLKVIEEKINSSKLSLFLKYDEWFLPRITIRGEVLAPINKAQLEVLQEVKEEYKEKALLFSIPTQNRQKRNFRLAVLSGCILPNTDFDRSEFQNAILMRAQLQMASFHKAQLQGADLYGAQIQGGNFSLSKLENTDLREAQLQKTNFIGAHLNKVNFERAQLMVSTFKSASLKEIKFGSAYLRAVNFYKSKLKRIDFNNAILHGAFFPGAYLQGSNLTNAQLQGADLTGAQLQGAFLGYAQLQGANLENAQLQGAFLREANFQGAFLMNTHFQGADIRGVKFQGADLKNAQFQGAVSTKYYPFGNRLLKNADIANINPDILELKDIELLIKNLKTMKLFYRKDIQEIKQRLQIAIGKKPTKFLEGQEGINLRGLSKEIFDKIANDVTEPKTRIQMGLPLVINQVK